MIMIMIGGAEEPCHVFGGKQRLDLQVCDGMGVRSKDIVVGIHGFRLLVTLVAEYEG